jgi:hypothetical protein
MAAFLALVYTVGTAAVVWSLSNGRGFDPEIARGAAGPCAIATMMTAVLVGPALRRLEIRFGRTVALRTALAWIIVGTAWPFANALADLLTGGQPGGPFLVLALMVMGAIFGAAGGLAGGAAGALLAIRRL